MNFEIESLEPFQNSDYPEILGIEMYVNGIFTAVIFKKKQDKWFLSSFVVADKDPNVTAFIQREDVMHRLLNYPNVRLYTLFVSNSL